MELIDNIIRLLGNLQQIIQPWTRLKIAAACFESPRKTSIRDLKSE